MPIPDTIPTIARIRKAIARMVVEYQETGEYLDLDGKKHTNTEGILNAWEEIERLGGKL